MADFQARLVGIAELCELGSAMPPSQLRFVRRFMFGSLAPFPTALSSFRYCSSLADLHWL
jgi:hypothetical protein